MNTYFFLKKKKRKSNQNRFGDVTRLSSTTYVGRFSCTLILLFVKGYVWYWGRIERKKIIDRMEKWREKTLVV